MGNYSKLWGAIIGSVAGIAVSKGVVPADAVTPDNINLIIGGVGALATIGSAVATWLFPANKPPT